MWLLALITGNWLKITKQNCRYWGWGSLAKSVTLSHPGTELFYNCYEIAKCNEKMTSSEPSVTLLHICSVWNEQKPQEVLLAFQVEAAILRVKDVNVWDSLSWLEAHRARSWGSNCTWISCESTGHKASQLNACAWLFSASIRALGCVVSKCHCSHIFIVPWLTLFSFSPPFFPF